MLDSPRTIRPSWCSEIFVLALLVVATSFPLVSRAQPDTGEAPHIDEQTGAVTIRGFKLTPKSVDTAGWSEDHKSVLLRFSLRKAPKEERFTELPIKALEAKLNGDPIPLPNDSLQTNTNPLTFLFMIDRSGSMVARRDGTGADKLLAARESLHYFVNNLGHSDQSAIYAFDLDQILIVDLTNNPTRLNSAIDMITTAYRDTALYDSIGFALKKSKDRTKCIVFLSDGKEDTQEWRAHQESSLAGLKQANENKLSDIARAQGVSFYAIAIGERGNETNLGVDYQTLNNIAEKSTGKAILIDMPVLNQKTGGDPRMLTQALTEKLKDVLAEIKALEEFDYFVRVPLTNLQEGDGELALNVTVDKAGMEGGQITFPIVYNYSWRKNSGPPIFRNGVVRRPFFIAIDPQLEWQVITQIYLLLLSPLVLLGLLPSVLNRISTAIEVNRISNAIELISSGSPYEGQQCPNELGPAGQKYFFKPGDRVLVCPRCHTPHHLSCWQYNEHQCMNRVCEYQFVVPPRVLERYGVVAEKRKQFA